MMLVFVFLAISELELFTQEELKVVSPTLKPEPIEEAPAVITVLRKEDILRLPCYTLIDVLKTIPDIEVSMGSDGEWRVALRGQRTPGEILLLIDGHRVNDFYTGGAIFDLPVEFIERIEVIRGPGSAIFGTDALCGVINIITDTLYKNTFAISGGNNYTVENLIKAKFKGMRMFTKLSHSDGFKEFIEKDSAYTKRNLSEIFSKFDYTGRNLRFMFLSHYRERGAYVGPVFVCAPDSRLKFGNLLCDLQFIKDFEDIHSLTRIYFDFMGRDLLWQEVPSGYISPLSRDTFADGKFTHEKYKEISGGIEERLFYRISDKLDVLLGVQFEYLSLPEFKILRNYCIIGDKYMGEFGNWDSLTFPQSGRSRKVFAFYLQKCYRTHLMRLTLGFRFDKYSDVEKSPINPRVGLVFTPVKPLSIKLLFGQAFRAPTFKELYDRSNTGVDAIWGDSTLSPELIRTYEASITYRLLKLKIRVNGFYSELSGCIRAFDPHGGGQLGYYKNIGDVKSYGGAFELRGMLFNTGLFLNLSLFNSVFYWNRELGEPYLYAIKAWDGTWLRNIPRLRINAGIDFRIRKRTIIRWTINYGNYLDTLTSNRRMELERLHTASIPPYLETGIAFLHSMNNLFLKISMINLQIMRKYSDPVETSNIDVFGKKGLIQPGSMFLIRVGYAF